MPALEEQPVRNKATRPVDNDVLVDLENHPIEEKKRPFSVAAGWRLAQPSRSSARLVMSRPFSSTTSLTKAPTMPSSTPISSVSLPKSPGRISAVKVNDNQFVKKGEVLLEIDSRDIEAMVAQKRAALEVAQARLENARMNTEQAEAHVNTLLAAYASVQASTSRLRPKRKRCAATWRGTAIWWRAAPFPRRTSSIRKVTRSLPKPRLSRKRNNSRPRLPMRRKGENKPAQRRPRPTLRRRKWSKSQAELHQAELQKSYTRRSHARSRPCDEQMD